MLLFIVILIAYAGDTAALAMSIHRHNPVNSSIAISGMALMLVMLHGYMTRR